MWWQLYQREDDKEEVLNRRLEIYVQQTESIITFYKAKGLLKNISAIGDVESITKTAISALEK